jgi:hypothetical protein
VCTKAIKQPRVCDRYIVPARVAGFADIFMTPVHGAAGQCTLARMQESAVQIPPAARIFKFIFNPVLGSVDIQDSHSV